MKKFAAIFLLFFMSVQTASAILPLLVAGANIVSVALKTKTGQDIAIGGVLGVGLIVAQMNWTRNGTDGSSKTDSIYYDNTPRAPSAIEAAEGFTAGSPSLTPAASIPAQILYIGYQDINYSSQDSACASYNSVYPTFAPFISGNVTATLQIVGNCFSVTNSSYGLAIAGIPGCPAGYSQSGVSCVLSNESLVPRPVDGHCPINRSGSSYAVDSTDPDCAAGTSPSFAADGTFSISSADGRKVESFPTGVANQRKIVYSYPDTTKNTTVTRSILIEDGATAADASTITGVIDSEIAGTGAAEGTAAAAATDVDLSPVVDAVNAQNAASEAWRAGEAGRTATDRALPILNESIPEEFIPLSGTAVVFSSSASCPSPIDFSMFAQNYSISYDPMCNLMSTLRPLFLALGAFAAAFIFIGGLKS